MSQLRRHLRLGRRAAALALVAVAALAGPAAGLAGTGQGGAGDSHRARTPIKHFVFLFQENHTFDNYFGTRPGVDGIPPGTCMPVKPGIKKPCVKPYWIGNSPVLDLGHTDTQFKREYRGGAMDGFVEANSDNGRDGSLAMGHYDARDLPYYWNLADNYVLYDRFFSSARGGSVANHMYAVTGVPGVTGKSESIPPNGWGNIPTIFDRLQASGVSWKFYIENYDPHITYRSRDRVEKVDRAAQVVWAPVLAYARFLDNPELNKHIVDMSQFYTDAQQGKLPAVSYIEPSGNSEHPPGRIQAGEELVRSLLNELMRSSAWDSSAFIWTYDDWGGWYDHVKPPKVDAHGYGFRVPALLVSPYAKKGYVSHVTNDFTSILKFIETNWNLRPLASRDRKANDLMESFDFSKGPRPAVILSTSRHQVTPEHPDARPVYAAYVLGMGVLLGFAALARWRTVRRGVHPKALLSPDVIDGRELP
ncbi:MAG: alkaline phosphatase family protein [Nocardioides sp.]